MTRPLDALAEVLLAFGRDYGVAGLIIRSDAEDVARACLRAIGEGKVVTRAQVAQVIAGSDDYWENIPGVGEIADALLALFREAGE